MFNLDKLNLPSDIQDLDAEGLVKLLGEHRNVLIKPALIIVSLLALGLMFNDHRIKDQDLRVQVSQMQQKLQVLKARDASVDGLNNFISSLPKKINEVELITLISDYAKLYHVTIVSLSPAQTKNSDLYDLVKVNFEVTADNFKDTMLFLRKIEKSKFPLRIDSWSGTKDLSGKIICEIGISVVLLHI